MKKKSTTKNFIFQTMYQILLIITPLITAPYISRILGPENVGINAYSYAITTYFAIFAALGIENYGSRTIASSRDNKEILNRKFSEIFIIHFIIGIIVLITFMLFCFFGVKENRVIFLLQSFYIVGIIFDINWLYFGVEDFSSVVFKNCILKILSVICILVFVRKKTDLPIYVFILAFSTFLNYSILWLGYRKHTKLVRIKILDAVQHVRPLCILFLPVIAMSLYKYIDKIMLGNLSGQVSVGYYESGERIINLCLGIITAFGTVMLPRISYLIEKGDRNGAEYYLSNSVLFMGIIAMGMGGGLYNIAETFVPFFFGEGYEPSINVIKVLAISMPFSALANIIKTQYLLPNKKDKSFAITLTLGACLNFFLNCLLIPKYDVLGAAIGTLFTEIAVCLVQIGISEKNMKIIKKARVFIVLFPGILIMGITMSFISNVGSSVLITLITKIVVGGFSYLIYVFFVLLIVKRELLLQMKAYIDKQKNK